MRIAVILVLAVGLGGSRTFAVGIFDFIGKALGMVDQVISIANGLDDLTGLSDNHQELLHRFDDIDNSIQGLDRDVEAIISLLRDMQSSEKRIRWDMTVETLETLLRRVTSKYDLFLFYQKNTSAIERLTLEDFARQAVSHNTDSLQSTLYNLGGLVTNGGLGLEQPQPVSQQPQAQPGSGQADPHARHKRYAVKPGLFRELKSLVEASPHMVCGLDKSPQQFAYGLYGTLAMALAKDYVMTQFAYMLLRLFGDGSFTAESLHSTESYKNISLAVALEASAVMRHLPPVFWRCDPARHERGATYEEVTELLQGHVENEVDLSSSSSCAGSCSDFHTSRTNRCYGATGHPQSSSAMLCERQRHCNGTLHDCRFVASSATVCLANATSHRRYNWIEYSGGRVLGRNSDASLGSCSSTLQVSSWVRGFSQCSSCFCLCDDNTNSERVFSLRPAVSDVTENKVVTGVRFVKIDGVFYIQLEQGVADKMGYVTPSTIQWKPVDRHIDINKDAEGHDFVRLSFERRSVLLQDLTGPSGHVVTGVSFHTVGDHLSLQIRVTAVSGTLTPSETVALTPSFSFWLAGNNSNPSPLKLGLDPKLDGDSLTPNWPDSRPNQTLTFQASSMDADAAQTTLPLLDVQPVAPRPAVWLTGIGLYHKGQKGGGGFLGLRVQMADMMLPRKLEKLMTVHGGDDKDLYRVSRSL